MAVLAVNLSQVPPAVQQALHKICTDENAMAMVQARQRQMEMAEWYRAHPPQFKEGFGSQEMAIDPFWISQFRMQFGTDPVSDPDFRAWLRRQGEDQFFTRPVSSKIQVGWTAPVRGTVKFRKSYGEN